MKCFAIFAAAIALASSAIELVHAEGTTPEGDKDWSYKTNDNSAYLPSEWGQKYPTCNGQRQSPIDIVPKTVCDDASVERKVPLVLSGECSNYRVQELHEGFRISPQGSTCQVAANGKPHNFLQAHFHMPSEHTINGNAYDAEIHYVHQAADGSGLLVIGLFFERQAGATTDPFVLDFIQQIKNVHGNTTVNATFPSFFPTLQSTIAAGRLFNYPGSLTTPACNETVDWWVVEKPLAVAPSDLDAVQADMKRIELADNGKNARPTQPLNGRIVTPY